MHEVITPVVGRACIIVLVPTGPEEFVLAVYVVALRGRPECGLTGRFRVWGGVGDGVGLLK